MKNPPTMSTGRCWSVCPHGCPRGVVRQLYLGGKFGGGSPGGHPLIYASLWAAFGRPLALANAVWQNPPNCTFIRFSRPLGRYLRCEAWRNMLLISPALALRRLWRRCPAQEPLNLVTRHFAGPCAIPSVSVSFALSLFTSHLTGVGMIIPSTWPKLFKPGERRPAAW